MVVVAKMAGNYNQNSAPYPVDGGNFPNQPPPYSETSNDQFTSGSFSDKSVRRAFIRKVYLILSLQMAITLAIVCVFTFVPSVRRVVQQNNWIYILAYVVFLVTYITLACCVNCRRRSPGNIICLLIFTLALSYIAGAIAAYHSTQAVVIALVMTVVLCLAITLFAFQTRWDFTLCSGFIFVVCMALFLTGIACTIVYLVSGPNKVLQAVYAGLALLLFSFLLVYDTQMVVGGKRYELSEEEYIFGAMQIYVDVMMILMALIGIAGASD